MQTRLHASSLKRLRYAPGPALLALAALALAAPAQAGSITVNNTDCTLVNAINAANNANGVAPVDSIGVGSCTRATAGRNTLTLTADVDFVEGNVLTNKSRYALPEIRSEIVIEGRGYTLRNTRTGTQSFFDFFSLTDSSANLSLRDLTFTGGNGAFGAIYCTAGTLNVTRSLFTDGNAGDSGALTVFAACKATISNSTFAGNNSNRSGAINAQPLTGSVLLNQITVTRNRTNDGVSAAGAITVAASSPDVTIANSVIAGNVGFDLHSVGKGLFINKGGRNIIGDGSKTAAEALFRFTPHPTDIVATSTAATGGVHTPTALANILELDTTVTPNVPALKDNGGLTRTVALVAGSPAVNPTRLPTDPVPPLRGDQRRYIPDASGKFPDTVRDIGAFELLAVPAIAPSAPTALSVAPGDGTLTVSFTAGEEGTAPITNYSYALGESEDFTAFDPADGSSPVTISGLTNGTEVTLRLKAISEDGESAASASISATPQAVTDGACGTASGLIATASAPVENLCASGTATAVVGNNNGRWNWDCAGSGGGTSTTGFACSAPYASQTITLTASPTSITVGGEGSAISASSNSGRPATLSTSTGTVCSLGTSSGSAAQVTATASGLKGGSCTIAANLAGTGDIGDSRYVAAAEQTVSITVAKGAQTITAFAAAKSPLKVGEMTTLSATGGPSGNAVTFSSLSSEICFVSGAMVTALSAGTCTVAANQAGNDGYDAATQETLDITVAKAAQLISGFSANPSSIKVGGMTTLSASGGASGNAVSFRTTTGDVCSVSGAIVTGLSAGNCALIASQDGNSDFDAADEVSLTVPVAKAAQLISGFASSPASLKVGQTGSLSASGGASGKPIVFASTTADTCSVSGSTVTALAVGTCTVTASQAGSADFDAAETVMLNIGIEAADVVPAPALSLDMNDLDFGTGYLLRFRDIGVETTSEPEVVTLSNTGTAPLSISSIVTTGDFRHTTTCGSTVAPGARCTIAIRFSPKAVGTRTGETRIVSNAVTSPDRISLSGTGKGLKPAMKTNVSRFDFGRVKVGASSREQTLVITSTGSGPLEIRSIRVSGDYSGSHNCPRFLDAGKSCQVTGSFKPKAVGTRPGSVSILTSVSNTATEVSLTGTGF